jgi:hypothetical protein
VRLWPAVKLSRSRNTGRRLLGIAPVAVSRADQLLVDAEAFQAAMEPPGPQRISVVVGNKGAVFVGDGLCHPASTPRTEDRHYGRGRGKTQLTVRQRTARSARPEWVKS